MDVLVRSVVECDRAPLAPGRSQQFHGFGTLTRRGGDAGAIDFPNLKITLAASTAQTWLNWHDDFVVKGDSGAENERAGSIVYLDPLKNELGRVNLSNCGIFRLAPEKVEAGMDAIPRYVAELYCERMDLVVKTAN